MTNKFKKVCSVFYVGVLLLLGSGCASMMGPSLTAPQDVQVPTPIEGNSGKYMCPFTSDETVAEWVKAGMSAGVGSSVGGAAGAIAGQQALKQIPFVGGFLGQKAGAAAGRAIAVKAAGGMESIKEKSDLSFNTINDLSVYIYAKHSTHPDFQKVFKLTGQIYPEFKTGYYAAIRNAPKKVVAPVEGASIAVPSEANAVVVSKASAVNPYALEVAE